MELIRNHLKIRTATEHDAELLASWWNDGNIMEHAGFPNGVGTTPDIVREQIRTGEEDGIYRFIIEIENKPAGEMCYRDFDPTDKSYELGIKICEASKQEQGNGTALLKMLMKYLFDEQGAEKLKLDTMLENKRAQHVYEHKLGFTKTSVEKDCWIDQAGNSRSAVFFELLKEDFKS